MKLKKSYIFFQNLIIYIKLELSPQIFHYGALLWLLLGWIETVCTVQVFGGMFLNSASFNNILGRMIFYVVGEIMTRNDNKNGHL